MAVLGIAVLNMRLLTPALTVAVGRAPSAATTVGALDLRLRLWMV
jgi:hypothetical protein